MENITFVSLSKNQMHQQITAAVFHSYSEIIVLKSVLESRKIPHLFENETLIAVDPLASLAYGGIRLKIHPEDLEEVSKILNDLNNHLKIV